MITDVGAGHHSPAVAGVLTRVGDAIEGVFGTLREVRDASARCVRRRGRPPVAADLAGLRPLLWDRLNGTGVAALIAGIGFIAAPGLLADAHWYLEWWQENPAGAPLQLLRDLDPSSSAFYDYTHWDWYTGPLSGTESTICGPYVDYLCTDEYSLTLSVPVVLDGAFIGVAAADVFVRRFEGLVLPALREIPPRRSSSTRAAVWSPRTPRDGSPDPSTEAPRASPYGPSAACRCLWSQPRAESVRGSTFHRRCDFRPRAPFRSSPIRRPDR